MSRPVAIERLRLGTIDIVAGAADPNVALIEAPAGSVYHRTDGTTYRGDGTPDGWTEQVGGGSSNPITLNPVVASTDEDTTLAGNILAGSSTTVGTLSVMQFSVAGEAGVHQAGSTVVIASRGTLSIAVNGDYEFIPLADYNGGVPVVTFQATNGSDIRIATLTITVGAVNDPPIANDDARLTFVDTPVTINVLTNDQDVDADALTVTHMNGSPVVVDAPVDIGDAVVTYLGDGEFLVTPDAAFEGEVSFTYTVSDGAASDTGTVTVLVGVSNDPMFSTAVPATAEAYNFGLTFMNRLGNEWSNGVNVSVPPYSANQGLFSLQDREPWLYDRATTAYVLYLRTQDDTIRDHAIALADQYMASVTVAGGNGRFEVYGGANGADPTDIKYLYPIIGVWYEKITGSSVHRAKSLALYNQTLLSFAKTYNPLSAALWTERNAGYAIQNCTAAYWLHRLAGNAAAANVALVDAWDYFEMVEGMSAASGAPLHGHNQHEGSAITTPITSPWMAGFLAESVLQLYRTDPDPSILTWLSNYGDFVHDHCCYVASEFADVLAPYNGLRLPAYLAGELIQYAEGDLLDMEHAHDVANLLKKCVWAKTELALSTTNLTNLIDELETMAEGVFAYWTRTTEGYPRYRVNPPRKYGWWFRNNYSDTALFFTEQVPTTPLLLTTISISGSTQSGQTLTATPGTWDASPAAVLTYQWYRGATPIGGATATTYVTQVADEGAAVTCRETATNDAGSAYQTSNAINVVPAGAPEITVHPTNATAAVGATASFTAECDASPAATFQWERSTNGGSSWANVAEGTGGSGAGNTTTYETEALAGDDSGNLVRCVFSNVNGSATTDPAAISMVVDQGSARFTANNTGAEIVHDLGAPGHADLVWEALMYFEGKLSNANFIGIRHTGNGRQSLIGCNNVFEVDALGPRDSNTGHTAWPDQPPLNTWLHVTWQAQTTAGGDQIRATWTVAEGAEGTRYAATRANGIEDSVQAQALFVGGLVAGQPGQPAVRVQYIRARTGYLDNATVDGHRHDVDTAGWDYWLRFFDAGGGTLGVEDMTGNNRVPTITGGTFATGPVVPGVA